MKSHHHFKRQLSLPVKRNQSYNTPLRKATSDLYKKPHPNDSCHGTTLKSSCKKINLTVKPLTRDSEAKTKTELKDTACISKLLQTK
jgi:hypothetical protein